MEYFDLYDKNGIKLNKTMARGTSNRKGEYHKVVHVWIKNSQGEYLVQQRNKATDLNPYQWAPTAGACSVGEDIFTTAIRETKEEIGLDISQKEMIHLDSYFVDDLKANFIVEIFLVNKDVDLHELTLDKREVKDVAFLSQKEIYEMIDANKFWNFLIFLPKFDYFSVLEKSN